MDLQNVITAQVLGAKRYAIDGNQFGSLFLAQPTSDTSGDTIGLEVMKVSCPYALLDTIKDAVLPGQFEIKVNMKAAGGGKLALEALALRPVNGNGSRSVKA